MIENKNTAVLSQINSPAAPSHLFTRKRLLDLLTTDKKLLLICSPAGYGKTTLVLDYLKNNDIVYGWVNITENTEHVFTYFQVIISALRKANPKFGSDTLQLLKSHFDRNKFNVNAHGAINDVILTFKEDFNNSFKSGTALVLDDYHHIENSDWKDYATESLLKNMPDNLQLIITSRQVPDIDFTHLVMNDSVSKIEMEDLAFNKSEAANLVASKYNIPVTSQIEKLTENMGGWVTGLHLLMQGMGKKTADGNEDIEIEEQPIPENIFDFLAERIFLKFDSETQNLLLTTSVIENYDKELCVFLGINNFDDIMQSLIDNYTFVQTVPLQYGEGPSVISYNYPILFRNYVKSKLYSAKSEKEIKKIFKNVYTFYDGKKDTVTSIKYMIQAGDHSEALMRINAQFLELYNVGKIEFLWEWMNAIGSGLIEKDPVSLVNYGSLKRFYTGDLSSALNYFDKAIEILNSTKNYELLIYAYTNKAGVLRSLGRTSEVIKEFESLSADKRFSDFSDRINYNLAYALFHGAEYIRAEELLNNTAVPGTGSADKDLLANINRLLGHIYLIRGNYRKAVSFYEKAIRDEKNILDKFEVLCNLTLLSSQSAEYAKARSSLDELEEIFKRFPTPVFKIPLLLAKQAFLFESGDFENAVKVLTEINEIAMSLNQKQYIYLSCRLLTQCYYYKGENDNAIEYYKLTQPYIEKENILKQTELEISKALLKKIRGKEEAKIFLDAYKYYKENSLLYSLAQVCYYLADFYLREGNTDKSYKYLNECLEICALNGYDSLLIREYRFHSSLFENNANGAWQTYVEHIKEIALAK